MQHYIVFGPISSTCSVFHLHSWDFLCFILIVLLFYLIRTDLIKEEEKERKKKPLFSCFYGVWFEARVIPLTIHLVILPSSIQADLTEPVTEHGVGIHGSSKWENALRIFLMCSGPYHGGDWRGEELKSTELGRPLYFCRDRGCPFPSSTSLPFASSKWPFS